MAESAGASGGLSRRQKINAAPDADNTAVRNADVYRLIEALLAESEITPGNILAPHRERSIGRMRGQRHVSWRSRAART